MNYYRLNWSLALTHAYTQSIPVCMEHWPAHCRQPAQVRAASATLHPLILIPAYLVSLLRCASSIARKLSKLLSAMDVGGTRFSAWWLEHIASAVVMSDNLLGLALKHKE